MNLYIDARALQKPHWRGEQLYVHRMLDQMTQLDAGVRFHLHFGWAGWDPRIDTLLARSNVRAHVHRGRVRSHAALPLAIARSRSRVYFRMYNEDGAMRVPVPAAVAVLVLDNGRHLLPREYGIADAARLRRETQRRIHSFRLIVTISETVKREIVELFAVDPERIVVAPCAVDRPACEAPPQRPVALDDGATFLLMVNPGGANKNWQDALDAYARFARVHGKNGAPPLVLAGDLASERERITAVIAADPILARGVRCLGYVSDAQLRWLYGHARLALFPSRYEGFGLPVLEAMAHEVPVIASGIPVLHEVAADAAAFFDVGAPDQLAEVLARVLCDERLRARLIARGRRRVEAFSWQDSARTVLDALLGAAGR